MSDHTNLPTCDWCIRPLAPDGVSWDNVDDPEVYCWGDEQQGCACDDVHEEAWPKMLSEVARLRGLLGEAIEGLQEFVCDDEQGCCPASPCEIETKPHCRLAGLLGRLAAAPEEAWKRVERLVEEYEQSEQERLGELLTGIRDDLARIEARVDRTEELVERLLRALGEEVTP